MRAQIILCCALFFINATSGHLHNAVETEMFSIPISPNLFNWTYQEFDQQYRFLASLAGKPELPSWLRYIYSGRHHSGFIFGTPPRGSSKHTITLEVIGLNRQDFETRRVLLTLKVRPKDNMARYEVVLKIDNLNVEDLLDEHRMTRLKDILRTKLWKESSQDLYPTFLASAIDLGARLPLKPSDGEGLVVRLGSSKPFSTELTRLREEVRPLSRLPSCPRDYKRTTVERLFRDAGLTLDWCNFELYKTIYTDRHTEHLEYLKEIPLNSKSEKSFKALVNSLDTWSWSAPSISSLPLRGYFKQITMTAAIPCLLLILSSAVVSALMCLHYDAIVQSSPVELCLYGTGNTEQTQVADNTSNRSLGASPTNSLGRSNSPNSSRARRPYSPKSTTNLAGNYNRPHPPPYMGSAANTLHHRKSGGHTENLDNINKPTPPASGDTFEYRCQLALEESLKALNEANISNSEFDPILEDPVVDLADGTDDYVPIKPDSAGYISMKADQTGHATMKSDLDDINVPELSKYGLGGVVGAVRHDVSADGTKPPVKTWFC